MDDLDLIIGGKGDEDCTERITQVKELTTELFNKLGVTQINDGEYAIEINYAGNDE